MTPATDPLDVGWARGDVPIGPCSDGDAPCEWENGLWVVCEVHRAVILNQKEKVV